MGDWPRLVNLRRCARGAIFDAGEATNTTLVLTNNSTGAELILLWQYMNDPNGAGVTTMSYQQGFTLTPGGAIAAVVPGDAPPPGALSSGDSPTFFPPDYIPSGSGNIFWPATFPMAVLLPGWSLVMQATFGLATVAVGVSLFWESILPKYFDRMYTHQYLELALMAQGG